jgi:hypothetical protein
MIFGEMVVLLLVLGFALKKSTVIVIVVESIHYFVNVDRNISLKAGSYQHS